MSAPNKAIWGPAFWTLLHSWAERLGEDRDPYVEAEIVTHWSRFIRWLPDVLPCIVCQEHARLQRRPNFLKLKGSALHVAARDWLYNFHNEVNERLAKGGRPFPISELLSYRTRDLKDTYNLLLENIRQGVAANIVRYESYAAWKIHADRLSALLGI
jgi:hypothetical protein